MKLEWMGKYRDLVEAHIKSANRYAQTYHDRWFHYEDVAMSAAQIQVLEYILERDYPSMSDLASRLGISRATLTKHVSTLESFGLLEKLHPSDNAKVYALRVTEKGCRAYEVYTQEILKRLFSRVFSVLDGMDESELGHMKQIYTIVNESLGKDPSAEGDPETPKQGKV